MYLQHKNKKKTAISPTYFFFYTRIEANKLKHVKLRFFFF